MIHQREHDFGYGDKADRERGNGDGELLTDHGLGLEISSTRPARNALHRQYHAQRQ
jgi:hypothetical protein